MLIGQVLTNLVDNALKYTPAGTPIEISAATDRGGPADLPGGSRPRSAAPARSDACSTSSTVRDPKLGPGGVGLGLTICRAVVEAHGGRIWAENRADGGARFCFIAAAVR